MSGYRGEPTDEELDLAVLLALTGEQVGQEELNVDHAEAVAEMRQNRAHAVPWQQRTQRG